MAKICDLGRTVSSFLHKTAANIYWLPPLVARLSAGWLFLVTGWGKLHNLDKVTQFFTQLGIPAPHLQAPIVATNEFVCGALLIVGLFTRLATIPLAISMAVALLTAKRDQIGAFDDLFGSSEYLYIVVFLFLFVYGAGKFSLDAWLSRRCKK